MQLNENIKILPESSVSVKKRVRDFLDRNPSATLIRLDQNLMNMPLPELVTNGMKEAVEEIAHPFGARLESPWSGYESLKKSIIEQMRSMQVDITESEIFITSGLESAYSCLSALFSSENRVLLTDPCEKSLPQLHYSSGRTLSFVRSMPENAFVPEPPLSQTADLVFLASPNPVTGVAMTYEQLKKWVDWANETESILFFDASLAEYLDPRGPYPQSIYQIPGARECAVELFSFEKGFGVRELKIAFAAIPHTVQRMGTRLNALFCARQPVTATPPSFVMQKAAELIFSPAAKPDTDRLIYRIKKVSRILSQGLTAAGIPHVGGETSPYLWAQCPKGMSAWQCFDYFLEKANLVVTPGSRFGYGGEHFFRITSFGVPEEAEEAALKIQMLFGTEPPVPAKPSREDEVAAMLFSEP